MTRYNASGAMGLIVNRPTKLSVKRFLPAAETSQGVYFGGPVELSGLFVLQDTEPKEGAQVIPGVFLVSEPEAVRKAASASAKGVRLFAGYAGWGPGQLDGEMTLGSWHVLPGDPKLVFHAEPETIWERLVRRTEMLIASFRLVRQSDR